MNKVAIWIVVAIVVLGGGYAVTQKKSSSPTGEQKNEERKGPDRQSLKGLLASGRPQRCTFSRTDETSSVDGVAYIAGGKVRGDFTITTSGKAISSHMVLEGQTMHSWTDDPPMGFKMMVSGDAPAAQGQRAPVDADQLLDYRCEGWSVDQSKFGLPSGIQFKNFGAVTAPPAGAGSASASGAVNAKAMQCAACDQVPEAARAQCRAALQCS